MERITSEVNGYAGSAEIRWVENKWGVAHYEAFISVPFQNSGWENLFIYSKDKLTEATEKAKQYLETALSRCALCV